MLFICFDLLVLITCLIMYYVCIVHAINSHTFLIEAYYSLICKISSKGHGSLRIRRFLYFSLPSFSAGYLVIKFSYRSSRPEVICKKTVLKIFAKFTGKSLCQSLFLIKLQALRDSGTGVLLWILRNVSEHLQWLLLLLVSKKAKQVRQKNFKEWRQKMETETGLILLRDICLWHNVRFFLSF